MKIRTFTVWGWQRHLIYGLGATLSMVFVTWFLRTPTPQFTTAEKLPALLIPIAWLGIAWRLHSLREDYAARIAWVTRHGVSVVPGAARDWLGQRRGELDSQIDDVVDFWSAYLAKNDEHALNTADRIEEWLNGMALEVVVSDEPIHDIRHRVKGKGLTYPRKIVVQLPPAHMTSGYPQMFWAVVRHEFGHACLMAAGPVSDAEHHAYMRQAGWRDA